MTAATEVKCKFKTFPLYFYKNKSTLPVEAIGEQMTDTRIDLPQGTLDLLILRTLALEPQHGWAISERIHQVSSKTLFVDRKSTRLNSSHQIISYAVFCLKK